MNIRRPMPAAVADRLSDDLAAARAAVEVRDVGRAWKLLEEAHVLSQPWARPHIRVHAAMLALGWRIRDRREVLGQLLRIMVAGPGSFTGRYPEGNTGRASVPATRPMPVPDELRILLESGHG
jgi:hypothetical protein